MQHPTDYLGAIFPACCPSEHAVYNSKKERQKLEATVQQPATRVPNQTSCRSKWMWKETIEMKNASACGEEKQESVNGCEVLQREEMKVYGGRCEVLSGLYRCPIGTAFTASCDIS
jgi:hypothetical protein